MTAMGRPGRRVTPRGRPDRQPERAVQVSRMPAVICAECGAPLYYRPGRQDPAEVLGGHHEREHLARARQSSSSN